MLSARDVLTALTDLVLPDSCPGCDGRASPPACADCLGLLVGTPLPRAPDPLPPGLPVPWAVSEYAGAVRALIVAHKERGRLGLAAPLGAALARSVVGASSGATLPSSVVLVPVPSSAVAVRRRGHDPTLRIAHRAARWLREHGVAADVARVLRHARRVADQSGLDRTGRASNLAGAMVVAPRSARALLRSAPVAHVVVDDVVTTGATLLEAVRALRAARVPVAGTAVIAATQRLTRPPRPA